jgi:predicted metal-dependent peptidase
MQVTRIQKAMVGLLNSQPFFASILMRQKQLEDQSAKTMWTDGRTLGFNPEWVAEQDLTTLESVLAHEALHIAFAHHLRQGARDGEQWNDATDYAVNEELKRSEMTLGEGWFHDPAYAGMSAEQIYRMLAKAKQDEKQGEDEGDQATPGSSPQSALGKSEGAQNPITPDADPANADWTKGKGQPGEVRPMPAKDGGEMDAAELEEAETEQREMIAQCAQIARAKGKLPGNLDRLAEKELEPRVAWPEALRRWFKAKAKEDFSWSRPNRRYAHAGLYLPERVGVKMGALVVAVDLSGSITPQTLNHFGGELNGIVEEVKPSEVIVIYFDHAVRTVERYGEGEQIKLHGRGGGGTSFVPAVEWVEREGIVPDAMVYLTDLEGSFPAAPQWPILWAVTGRQTQAPFGEVISID